MNFSILVFAAAFGLGLSAPDAARARSIPGDMGFQSRGDIRISVSVMPRLDVAEVDRWARSEKEVVPGAQSLTTSSSRAGLRYTLVACHSECSQWPTNPDTIGAESIRVAPGSNGTRQQNGARLILVVPD